MTPTAILLVGAGGHAVACIDVIEKEGRFAVAGLVARTAELHRSVLSYRVVGEDTQLEEFVRKYENALVAIGQIKTAEPRVRVFNRLLRAGYKLPQIVSPRAYVSRHAQVGPGTIIMHGAIVNAGAQIGSNCIINTNALVEHDAVIGDHCHISTAAAVNGGAIVDTETFVGSGSVLREGIHIGANSVIGMGQYVRNDCEAGSRLPMKGGR